MKKAKGLVIKIDTNNKGTFTRYCKSLGFDSVTSACIRRGLKSKNTTTRKRANFARNARKWK